MVRAMHPEDARQMLRDYRRGRESAEASLATAQEALAPTVRRAVEAGLSKAEVARLVGVHRETLRRALNGSGRP